MNLETGRVDPRAYIRTYVPLLVGMLLGWLVTTFTVVRDLLQWADEVLIAAGAGVNARALLDAIAIAIVTAAYYWLARQLGRKWPQLERWLLGSSAIPIYGLTPGELTYVGAVADGSLTPNEARSALGLEEYTDTDTEGR